MQGAGGGPAGPVQLHDAHRLHVPLLYELAHAGHGLGRDLGEGTKAGSRSQRMSTRAPAMDEARDHAVHDHARAEDGQAPLGRLAPDGRGHGGRGVASLHRSAPLSWSQLRRGETTTHSKRSARRTCASTSCPILRPPGVGLSRREEHLAAGDAPGDGLRQGRLHADPGQDAQVAPISAPSSPATAAAWLERPPTHTPCVASLETSPTPRWGGGDAEGLDPRRSSWPGRSAVAWSRSVLSRDQGAELRRRGVGVDHRLQVAHGIEPLAGSLVGQFGQRLRVVRVSGEGHGQPPASPAVPLERMARITFWGPSTLENGAPTIVASGGRGKAGGRPAGRAAGRAGAGDSAVAVMPGRLRSGVGVGLRWPCTRCQVPCLQELRPAGVVWLIATIPSRELGSMS